MARVRARGEEIRGFILANVKQHAGDIGRVAAEKFGISRQAVNKHLQKLVSEGALAMAGKTRSRTYELSSLKTWSQTYAITPDLAEDVVWRNDVRPLLGTLPENVLDIWQFGFTEMFNNAIEHSDGTKILIQIDRRATATLVAVIDDGVGIFRKIQKELNLHDERHAVLELSKGKLTTDRKRHSGEGIFFTSRMFDVYSIRSRAVFFTHRFGKVEDWVIQTTELMEGTGVLMELGNHTSRTPQKVFAQFSSADDFAFNKTVVPVRLAQYEKENLISRSQAKRLLTRVDLFEIVVFDFEGVDMIGQAFADEIFRVFAQAHPQIKIRTENTHPDVEKMITRASASNVS